MPCGAVRERAEVGMCVWELLLWEIWQTAETGRKRGSLRGKTDWSKVGWPWRLRCLLWFHADLGRRKM